MNGFQWLIEALPNGRYRLKARGAPVADLRGFSLRHLG